ncbi:Glycosyltransferase involved in cell wall bisynthesis [Actinomadura meyerae]|uniref:Glycosyltransferase involved in cell wall bisynthesis n=1 Tax=Actinomadura meyerae TaxID=240840 RepID=A0A239NQZ6_9ACTN|nr:glycosyltransferase family 4 protein [Actinomadura meyerae]SNT56893.1 Glycosyltransferase involved in cell wall bisynthesis [Actinomadura meyerae]
MRGPLRIIYLLYNAHGVGGTVRTVFTQANTMVERGHEVDIVTMWRSHDNVPFHLDPRVRLTPLVDGRPGTDHTPPDPAAEDTSWHSLFPGKMSATAESRARVNALIEYLRGVHDGILVCTRPTITLIAKHFSDPRLVRVVQEHAHLSWHNPEWRAAIDAAYPDFDALVTLTAADHASYAEAFPGMGRVERIPNALHSLDVPQSDLSRKVVVSAGRLDRAKGFDHMIRAFAAVAERHPDWTLRIYGSGPEEERLRKMVLDMHLYNHVFMMGPTSELDEALAKASVFAMSSRSEGFGMVLLEALNCGLPAVSFDCPVGPREILTHGEDGLLVPTGDTGALADGLIRVIEDAGLRAGLAAGARKTAARYGPDVIGDQWERLFAELVAAKG